jgi:hypothetical protein
LGATISVFCRLECVYQEKILGEEIGFKELARFGENNFMLSES